MTHARSPVRPGFTLLELLIVIGVVGVIASIVIVAINPGKQMEDAQHAKRRSMIREQQNAVLQHMIGEGTNPIASAPTGAANAKRVCRASQTDATCINIDALVPEYLASLPQDPREADVLYTGYRVYQDSASRPVFCCDYLPVGDVQRCGNSTAEDVPDCGNSVVDAGETCDDGNQTSGDGCSATCSTEAPAPSSSIAAGVCGNGAVEEGETCDANGETAYCDLDCTAAACGDGTVNAAAGETCDDGNENNADACAACHNATCGDSYTYIGYEECDMGADNYFCDGNCTAPACGDSYANPAYGESCDDGNTMSNDGCNCGTVESGWSCAGTPSVCGTTCGDNITAGTEQCDMGPSDSLSCDGDCTNVTCGDTRINAVAGEVCDDGNGDNTDACINCQNATCGDGYVRSGVEYCDSGAGDVVGCDSDCTQVICGDGHTNITDGETCDDGNTSNGDGCAGSCRCGNGTIDGGETCDDYNQNNGDGCNSDCQNELS